MSHAVFLITGCEGLRPIKPYYMALLIPLLLFYAIVLIPVIYFDKKINKPTYWIEQYIPKKKFLPLIFVGAIFLYCLFFHTVISSKGIDFFAKDHPTFSHTFVTDDDLERFNEASSIQQLILLNDPFYRTLAKEGLLKGHSNNHKEE